MIKNNLIIRMGAFELESYNIIRNLFPIKIK